MFRLGRIHLSRKILHNQQPCEAAFGNGVFVWRIQFSPIPNMSKVDSKAWRVLLFFGYFFLHWTPFVLIGVWFGEDQRTSSVNDTCLQEIGLRFSDFISAIPRSNSARDWEDLHVLSYQTLTNNAHFRRSQLNQGRPDLRSDFFVVDLLMQDKAPIVM